MPRSAPSNSNTSCVARAHPWCSFTPGFRRLVWTTDRRAGAAPLSARHLSSYRIREQQPRQPIDQHRRTGGTAEIAPGATRIAPRASGRSLVRRADRDATRARCAGGGADLDAVGTRLTRFGRRVPESQPPFRSTARENTTPPSTHSCARWRRRTTAPPSSASIHERSTRPSPTHPLSSNTNCRRCEPSASAPTMRNDCERRY